MQAVSENNGAGENGFCRVESGKPSWRRCLQLLEEKSPACEEHERRRESVKRPVRLSSGETEG